MTNVSTWIIHTLTFPQFASLYGTVHCPFSPRESVQTSQVHPLQKRHIRDILGRTIFFCHTYDTSMTIIVTKPGIIIDMVGSYFYDKKS